MKLAYLTLLSLLLLFSTSVHSEELKASEVAAAHGMSWWSVDLSEMKDEQMTIHFEIEFADGKKEFSGSINFHQGDTIKVFCWPNLRGELQVAAIFNGGTGRMITRFHNNPFSKAKVETSASHIGSKVKPGAILLKATNGNSVTSSQTLEKGTFGLKVIIEPYHDK